MARLLARKLAAMASVVTGAIFSFLLLVSVVNAQIDVGTLIGVVSDPSGAVVPTAEIVVTSSATAAKWHATADDRGGFTVPNLPPGVYAVTVTRTGFSTGMTNNVQILVNQTTKLNVVLNVGSTKQIVEVTGAPPVVETGTSTLGTVIESKPVVDLPLNGRQFTQLLALTPGASPTKLGQVTSDAPLSGGFFPSFNGQTSRSNVFFIDGAYDSDPFFSGFTYSPSVDAIQEFKELSHSDQSEYGLAQGAVVNVVTKSGSNALHGSLWEFLRNDNVDARNFFQSSILPYHQNQFGATAGGRIVRDKLFFFGNYEGYRSILGNTIFSSVPTAAERGGDLSSLSTPIYNPYTTAADPANPGQYNRQLFPGNVIPTKMLDPGVQLFLNDEIPLPNYPGTFPNYVNDQPITTNQDQESGRIDYVLNSSNTIFGRFSHTYTKKLSPDDFANDPFVLSWPGWNMIGHWTHTLSPSSILHLSMGFDRFTYDQTVPPLPIEATVVDQGGFAAGYPPHFADTPYIEMPIMNASGWFSTFRGYGPEGPYNVWQANADYTKVKGTHTLKMGMSYLHMAGPQTWANGENDFSQVPTQNPESPTGTGSALASFLLSLPSDGFRYLGAPEVNLEAPFYGLYAQDMVKVTPKLTLNFGMRWDFNPQLKEKYNRISFFDIHSGYWVLAKNDKDAPSTLPARVKYLPGNVAFPNDYDQFSPRLGIAYQLDSKTVVRVAGGVGRDSLAGWFQVTQSPRGGWPSGAVQSPSGLNVLYPEVTAQNPFGLIGNSIPATPFPSGGWSLDTSYQPAVNYQWNFAIDRALTPTLGVTAAYVGSHASSLSTQYTYNTALTPGPGPYQQRAPFPFMDTFSLDSNNGTSSYDALQIQVNKRVAHGLTFLASYTWSKTISECDGYVGDSGCEPQNAYNLAAEKSLSHYDVPQVFVFSYGWDLPVGRGRPWLNNGGWASRIFGDWRINGITTADAGAPYTLFVGYDNANVGGGSLRPNLVGNPNEGTISRLNWFNTAAFAIPAQYTFGNLGRNTMRGPATFTFDFSVFRDIHLTETRYLQFRAEAFNLFNNVNWAQPDSTMSDPTFGQVLSAGEPRDIQFALKFYF